MKFQFSSANSHFCERVQIFRADFRLRIPVQVNDSVTTMINIGWLAQKNDQVEIRPWRERHPRIPVQVDEAFK